MNKLDFKWDYEGIEFNQHVTSKAEVSNFFPSITYSLPAFRRDVIDLQGSYQFNAKTSNNQAFRLNEETHHYDQLDTSESIDYQTIYQTTKLAADYRIQRVHYSVLLGGGIESDRLKAEGFGAKSNVNGLYWSFLPSVDFNLHPGNGKDLHINYNGKAVPLTAQQLQPVNTTTDSLVIQKGNSDLKQPFIHTFGLYYTSVQSMAQRSLSATLNAKYRLRLQCGLLLAGDQPTGKLLYRDLFLPVYLYQRKLGRFSGELLCLE